MGGGGWTEFLEKASLRKLEVSRPTRPAARRPNRAAALPTRQPYLAAERRFRSLALPANSLATLLLDVLSSLEADLPKQFSAALTAALAAVLARLPLKSIALLAKSVALLLSVVEAAAGPAKRVAVVRASSTSIPIPPDTRPATRRV